jgi:phosphoribosyl 1,2-cyclic phosphodiesterase
MLRFKNLGSGSSGNATVVEAGSGNHIRRLLIDCGLKPKVLLERLGRAGLAPAQVDAIFITHEHSDHLGCARQWALRHRTPVWMSAGTHLAAGESDFEGMLRLAQDGVNIDLGELQVTPFTVPHDAREPLQLSCSDGSRKLGVLTDLGHATAHVLAHLAGCHALLLECNHDVGLLAAGAYPAFLKQRVGGRFGHLSNVDAAQIAKSLDHTGLTRVIAAHLSRQNNRPDLAREAVALALGRVQADIGVATQDEGCDWINV